MDKVFILLLLCGSVRLHSAGAAAPSITITATTDPTNSLEADITINCPPDGFSDTFVVYFDSRRAAREQ